MMLMTHSLFIIIIIMQQMQFLTNDQNLSEGATAKEADPVWPIGRSVGRSVGLHSTLIGRNNSDISSVRRPRAPAGSRSEDKRPRRFGRLHVISRDGAALRQAGRPSDRDKTAFLTAAKIN